MIAERETIKNLADMLSITLEENRSLTASEREHVQTIFEQEKELAELRRNVVGSMPDGSTCTPGHWMLKDGSEHHSAESAIEHMGSRIADLEAHAAQMKETLRKRDEARVPECMELVGVEEPYQLFDTVEGLVAEVRQARHEVSMKQNHVDAQKLDLVEYQAQVKSLTSDRNDWRARAQKAGADHTEAETRLQQAHDKLRVRQATIGELEARLQAAAGPDRAPDVYADAAHAVVHVCTRIDESGGRGEAFVDAADPDRSIVGTDRGADGAG